MTATKTSKKTKRYGSQSTLWVSFGYPTEKGDDDGHDGDGEHDDDGKGRTRRKRRSVPIPTNTIPTKRKRPSQAIPKGRSHFCDQKKPI